MMAGFHQSLGSVHGAWRQAQNQRFPTPEPINANSWFFVDNERAPWISTSGGAVSSVVNVLQADQAPLEDRDADKSAFALVARRRYSFPTAWTEIVISGSELTSVGSSRHSGAPSEPSSSS